MILLVSLQWFLFMISFYYHSKVLIMHVCVCAYYVHTCAYWRMWMWVCSCYSSYVEITGQHLVSGPHIPPFWNRVLFWFMEVYTGWRRSFWRFPSGLQFLHRRPEIRNACGVCVSCLTFVWARAIWTQVRLIWQENTVIQWAITPVSVHWFLNRALLVD